jgi:hypothetical protein
MVMLTLYSIKLVLSCLVWQERTTNPLILEGISLVLDFPTSMYILIHMEPTGYI